MLVLASNSPRRRQLLALGGWAFQMIPARIDESPLPEEAPRDYVVRLAIQKAQVVSQKASGGNVVVAADTTVALEKEIFGKPASSVEAEAMLRRLRGRAHQVYTGLAVSQVGAGRLLSDACRSEVWMRDYSEEELLAYIASGDPLDKAGAYAIQHEGFNPVAGLEGCYANVMGLPLCHLARLLAQLGLSPATNIVSACQPALGYDCQVYQAVQRTI